MRQATVAWGERSPSGWPWSAQRIWLALADFGAPLDDLQVIGLSDLVENKRASGRDKDRIDIKGLNGTS